MEKYLPWLILREVPFVGNTLFRKLINQFHTPERVLNASEAELGTIDRISTRAVDGILQHHRYQDAARKELDQIINQKICITVLTDPAYPALLKQIPDPPPVLTYVGHLDSQSPCLSIVGSRTATAYGLTTSENLSYKLAARGFQIVSGLARGIDTMAHKGALRARGKTAAVLGSGLTVVYPRENESLYREIAEKGVIFSEFKVKSKPLAANFPIRNRIIAGLSCGSVVVEAARRSGSLITARLAMEYNREVFAVPGSIKSQKSEGTHSLLKQGAKLVENEMDIVEELYHFIHENKKKISDSSLQNQKSTPYIGGDTQKSQIINFLEPYPVHIDVLIEKTGMSASVITSQLLDLELEGRVHRHQGNYYSISEDHHWQNP
jgi:DNA processing protein